MSIYYIGTDLDRSGIKNAGAKAPDDIEQICCASGYHRISIHVFLYKTVFQKIWSIMLLIYQWLKIGTQIPKNAMIIYQHPMHGAYIANIMIPIVQKWKKCKFICIIHDLDSLRFNISSRINQKVKYNADNGFLRHFDCVICHNEYMKKYLVEQGFSEDKLICLEIFDYLVDKDICDVIFDELGNKKWNEKKEKSVSVKNATVAIAGNLSMTKAGYIYEIKNDEKNRNLQINLYGNGYDESRSTFGMVYKGSYDPNELLKHLEGKFGLVWDGTSAKTCAGGTGEYLRYNNPHKTSLYLAAGIPVIVWKEAAIADFVLKNRVGIVVETLEDLGTTLLGISEEEYKSMCANVAIIGQKIRTGEYFSTALAKAVESLNWKDGIM